MKENQALSKENTRIKKQLENTIFQVQSILLHNSDVLKSRFFSSDSETETESEDEDISETFAPAKRKASSLNDSVDIENMIFGSDEETESEEEELVLVPPPKKTKTHPVNPVQPPPKPRSMVYSNGNRYKETKAYPKIGTRLAIEWKMSDGTFQLYDGKVTELRGKIAIKYEDDQDSNCICVHKKNAIYMYHENDPVISGYVQRENEKIMYLQPTDATVSRTDVSSENSPLYWHNRISPNIGQRVKVLWKHAVNPGIPDLDIWRFGIVQPTKGHYCFNYDDEVVERLHPIKPSKKVKDLKRYELVTTTV